MDQHPKVDALELLQTLHVRLNSVLPGDAEMQEEVAERLKLGSNEARFRYLCSPEHAFTRGIALPKVHEELIKTFRLSADKAREALLAEGWANLKQVSSGTPARIVRHPFDKVMVSDAGGYPSKVDEKYVQTALNSKLPRFRITTSGTAQGCIRGEILFWWQCQKGCYGLSKRSVPSFLLPRSSANRQRATASMGL